MSKNQSSMIQRPIEENKKLRNVFLAASLAAGGLMGYLGAHIDIETRTPTAKEISEHKFEATDTIVTKLSLMDPLMLIVSGSLLTIFGVGAAKFQVEINKQKKAAGPKPPEL